MFGLAALGEFKTRSSRRGTQWEEERRVVSDSAIIPGTMVGYAQASWEKSSTGWLHVTATPYYRASFFFFFWAQYVR